MDQEADYRDSRVAGADDRVDGRDSWRACYTRARHEKRVDKRLRSEGFEVFTPLVPRERQWSDRTKVVMLPLFPGYVFSRFGRQDLHRVLSISGVASVVRFGEDPVAIPEREIEGVKRLTEAVAEGTLEPSVSPRPRTGEKVRIASGPFQGVEGTVTERRGDDRLLICAGIEVIGQGLRLEVEEAMVELLDSHEGVMSV